MKTLFFQPVMGAAGDMINACLYDLLEPKQQKAYLKMMNSLNLTDTEIRARKGESGGIAGIRMEVLVGGKEEDDLLRHEECSCHHDHHDVHDHGDHHHHPNAHHSDPEDSSTAHPQHFHDHDHHGEHHPDHHFHHHAHASLAEILQRIEKMPLSDEVRNNAAEIYRSLAEAESRAHGKPADQIHFHEVGTADALADIIGCCLLIEMIHPKRILSSPVCTGFGTVECAHGRLPVPAPAASWLLEGIPVFAGPAEGEMCTPTGAALLRHFVEDFEQMPACRYEKIGCGLGKREFRGQVSLLRCFLCDETADEQIAELDCNLDDMTGEQISFAMEKLFEAGAKDVFTTAVGMKKSRPGILLSVICSLDDRCRIAETIFRYTTTLGIREKVLKRYLLDRHESVLHSGAGEVRLKTASGYGASRAKFEYEDLRRIAIEQDVSLSEAAAMIMNTVSDDQFEDED